MQDLKCRALSLLNMFMHWQHSGSWNFFKYQSIKAVSTLCWHLHEHKRVQTWITTWNIFSAQISQRFHCQNSVKESLSAELRFGIEYWFSRLIIIFGNSCRFGQVLWCNTHATRRIRQRKFKCKKNIKRYFLGVNRWSSSVIAHRVLNAAPFFYCLLVFEIREFNLTR